MSTNEQKEVDFKTAATPLIEWLANNVHPHHKAIVTGSSAELLEGVCTTGPILDYVKD